MSEETCKSQAIDARVAAMVGRFAEIGETQMRTLPLYNDRLAVEAVDFQHWGDDWIGALITPWFINVMVLPGVPVSLDWSRVGKSLTIALPSGPAKFVWGGDEVIGHYQAQSVQSPVLDIPAQAAARQKARLALAKLLAAGEPAEVTSTAGPAPRAPSPGTESAVIDTAANTRGLAQSGLSRRDLLRGRRGHEG